MALLGLEASERRSVSLEEEPVTRDRDFAAQTKVNRQALERGRLWEVSTDLLGVLNAQGYFETTNPAWGTVLGWSPETIRSTSIFELIHPDDAEKTRGALKNIAGCEGSLHFDNRYRRKDGDYRWLSWIAVQQGS